MCYEEEHCIEIGNMHYVSDADLEEYPGLSLLLNLRSKVHGRLLLLRGNKNEVTKHFGRALGAIINDF